MEKIEINTNIHNLLDTSNISNSFSNNNKITSSNSIEKHDCIISNILTPQTDRRISNRTRESNSEIKTENNNSLIVELDDPDYLHQDPLDGLNTFDPVLLKFELGSEKYDKLQNEDNDVIMKDES
jgi:hypothetical protein